jgi:biotin operon repressor
MRFIDNLHRIERLKQLIQFKATGNANELAKKLGVCRRTVFTLLETIRQSGKKIRFNKYKQSYEFE